jgi:hypothetical protein
LPAAWEAVGAGYDKSVLTDQLNRLSTLCNKIMHFRKQDDLDAHLAAHLPSVVSVLQRLVAASDEASMPS